jgi:hypothetical protein
VIQRIDEIAPQLCLDPLANRRADDYRARRIANATDDLTATFLRCSHQRKKADKTENHA